MKQHNLYLLLMRIIFLDDILTHLEDKRCVRTDVGVLL